MPGVLVKFYILWKIRDCIFQINNNIQICLFKNQINHTCLNCVFPNDEDVELARCDTVGISSICAGIAGLITAQKTINTILKINNENNIL